MQKSKKIGVLVWLVSIVLGCNTPKEIIKSENILPNCRCEGYGNYTIVMDAGMGNWSLFYQPVFENLKNNFKVCVIDRVGYNMDSVSLNKRDAKTIAEEMEKALLAKGISDSIILIGHSLGGLHIRMYQSLYPQKVKGMVLLESAHPQQFERLPKEFLNLLYQQEKTLDKVMQLAQKDYLKYAKGKIPTFGIPNGLLDEYYKVTTRPEYYYTTKMEVLAFENSLQQVEKLASLDSLPLLVIASKKSMDETIIPNNTQNFPFEEHNLEWLKLQKELSNLSKKSKFVVSNKNHYLHVTDSTLVIEQIKIFMKQNFNTSK